MPCYSPLHGYRAKRPNPKTGRFPIVFTLSDGYVDKAIDVPCGQCIGCRLERSRQWAIRCVHESSLYEKNCFLTLTYDDEHLPSDGSVHLRDFQLFMKRLRKRFGAGIRFFACGEYGDLKGRPHYHVCVFNHDFEDRVLWRIREGVRLYKSVVADEVWQNGTVVIGNVTFESAAYVARYIVKKLIGHVTPENISSVYAGKSIEFATMSRRPGIASGWFAKFWQDVFPSDFVVLRGKKFLPPKFYDKCFEELNPEDMERIKCARKFTTEERRLDNDSFRLPVKEAVQEAKLTLLKRGFENGD